MGELTFLHLSDLHFSERNEHRVAPLLNAILDDVADMPGPGIDAIVFSGDLAFSGKRAQYEWLQQNFLEPLFEKTGVSKDRVFIAPGNHDVDIERIDPVLESGFAAMAANSSDIRSVLTAGAFDARQRVPRLATFAEFVQDMTGRASSRLNETVLVQDTGIGDLGIALVNTAWRATGAPENRDAKRLLVGMPDLEGQYQRIKDADFRVAVFHHPPDWIHESEQGVFEDFLQTNFHLVLYGHMHDEDPRDIRSPLGAALWFQAGCLDGGDLWPATFSLISVSAAHAGHTVTRIGRRYERRRKVFEADTSLNTDGTAEYTLGATKEDEAQRRTISLSMQALHDHARSISLSPDPRELQLASQMLVAPRFRAVSEATGAAAKALGREGSEETLGVDAVAAIAQTTVVLAERESGLTGSLLYLAETMMQQSGRPTVVVDTTEWSTGRDRDVAKLVGRGLPNAIRRTAELADFDVILDGVSVDSAEFAKALTRFIVAHPGRVVVGATPVAGRAVLSALGESRSSEHFRSFHLASLSTAALPELAQIVLGEVDDVAHDVFDRVVRVVDIEGLPRQPHVVGALIRVLVGGGSFAGHISEPSVIEAYTEELLGRHDSWESGEALDYEMRMRCLGLLAAEMVRTGVTQLSPGTAAEIVGEFLESIGSVVTADRLLADVRVRQVLSPEPLSVGFRIPAVRKLLSARTLSVAEIEALDHSNRDSFGVVRYRAGTSRESGESLAWAVAAAPDVENLPIPQLAAALPRLESKAGDEDDEVLIPPALGEGVIEGRADEWSEEPDEALNDLADTAISCLSSVVRDSDLLADVNAKLDALEIALHGWWHLFDALVRDTEFRDELTRELKEMGHELGEHNEDALAMVIALAGFFTTVGGAGRWLADERTRPLLERLRDSAPKHSPVWVLSTLLILQQAPPTVSALYAELFEAIEPESEFLWMLFGGLAYIDYCFASDLGSVDKRDLEDLLLKHRFGLKPGGSALAKDQASRARTELRQRRTQAQLQVRSRGSRWE